MLWACSFTKIKTAIHCQLFIYFKVKSACSAFPKTYVGPSSWAELGWAGELGALWPFTFFPSWQRGSVSGRPCPSTLHHHQHAAMPSLPSLLTSNCAPSSPSQLIMNGLSFEKVRLYLISGEEREQTDWQCPVLLSKQQQTRGIKLISNQVPSPFSCLALSRLKH